VRFGNVNVKAGFLQPGYGYPVSKRRAYLVYFMLVIGSE
jgi:hypothetical protein